jgi:hypothetical protein
VSFQEQFGDSRFALEAYPLSEFYADAGLPLPATQVVPGSEVPEPYRRLLVHQRDMTPTLEEHHGFSLELTVLRSYVRGEVYFRQVVLRAADDSSRVEFGAIAIDLACFTPRARNLIREEHWPLGRIMSECGVPHESRPRAFLRVRSDTLINDALGLDEPRILYGRRSSVTGPGGPPLAEVVEILPPAASRVPPSGAGRAW